ncbi:MAG: diaminopimelate epimerase [Verrucomicrobiales bacterium]
MIHFCKMNGAGNDFIVLDNRELAFALSGDEIARLCHRQFGIGADGLLVVEPPENGADYRMRYYNADGGEADMCGNGARCFAKFVNRLEESPRDELSFETRAGLIRATFPGDYVRVNLSDPFDICIGEEIEVGGETLTVHCLNTGVPHAVVAVETLGQTDVVGLGAAIRSHPRFAPAGTNVNFMEVLTPGTIAVRTFERGVEGETLACGTGVVANAIVHHELTASPSPVSVRVHSGAQLNVDFSRASSGNYSGVSLTGPAEFVFEGHITKPS